MGRKCDKYTAMLQDLTGPTLDKLQSDFSEMIELMLKLSGYTYDGSVTKLELMSHIKDTLICEVRFLYCMYVCVCVCVYVYVCVRVCNLR